MLVPIFKCLVCHASPDTASFPLCPSCLCSLILCPRLCLRCFELSCPSRGPDVPCHFPWLAQKPLDSLNALYLNLGAGYEVLKRWKKSGGPLFNRKILKWNRDLWTTMSSLKLTFIVPVPQTYHRSWNLGRSPANQVAQWLNLTLGVPVLQPFSPITSDSRQKRQAELPLEKRIQLRQSYKILTNRSRFMGANVLIVDDFVTSGRTLANAALAMREAGSSEVHGFCLGLRPRKRLSSTGENIQDVSLQK